MDQLYRYKDIDSNLKRSGLCPLDVVIVGGTGVGKSTTLNTLFNKDVAAVGKGCDPETQEITSMQLNDIFRVWDTPGLGDNVETDRVYARKLIETLYSQCTVEGIEYNLIDMVLVIIDGTGRDMGTTYKLLNDVILPNFPANRVLVAINQADMAMKGRHWNEKMNAPDPVLKKFLDDKVKSIKSRIKESTGVSIKDPVYYSAEKKYNVEKFLDLIVDNMPMSHRKISNVVERKRA